MNALYATTAVIEVGAGLALLCLPSAVADVLLGVPLDEPAALTVARVGGAGLLTLGVGCWLARTDTQSPAARGLITAMVIYNFSVAFILGAAGIRSVPVNLVLWPAAVVLHAAMVIWCVTGLLGWRPGRPESGSTELGFTNRPLRAVIKPRTNRSEREGEKLMWNRIWRLKHVALITLSVLLFVGIASAQYGQYPILDRVANKVIQKYQNSSCEQLWQERGQPKSQREQEAVNFLRSDPQMRQMFIDRVAAPVANKMFECGMIP